MSYRNAPIHPVLRLIYLLLRLISWLGVSVFYRRRIILGRDHLTFDGPAIIVVNHPSTLMDVLNPCVHIRQESFFLANYGLFKNPVTNWLLTRLYCIPVKRREDVAEGEGRNNEQAFEKSFQHLEKNGLLFIAAEGVSWMERWVRPFKTGAARIAFGTESRHHWELGVKILPIGMSYSAPNLFRSEVIVHFGAPIDVAPWMAADQQDHEKAVNDLTYNLEAIVRSLVLDTRDAEGQAFMEQLENLVRDKFPKNGQAYFSFRKGLIYNNIDNEALRSKMQTYTALLEASNLSDRVLTPPAASRVLLDAALLLLGFPVFLMGFIFWWLPCYLPWLLAKKMNLYIGYDSNVKMLAGLFTFPLAMWGALLLATHFSGNHWLGWATVLALVVAGYFAEYYLDIAHRWQDWRSGLALKKKNSSTFDQFMLLRKELLEMVKF